jgi:hypothetical protein
LNSVNLGYYLCTRILNIKIAQETLSRKNPSQKRDGGVAQDVGPEFKSHYNTQKKKVQSSI